MKIKKFTVGDKLETVGSLGVWEPGVILKVTEVFPGTVIVSDMNNITRCFWWHEVINNARLVQGL